MASARNVSRGPMITALSVSWAGLLVHYMREFPGLLFRVDSVISLLVPLLITVVLVLKWWRAPSRLTRHLIVGWAMVNLIGGGLVSFVPEPSVEHLISHLIYGLAQIPLVLIALRTSIDVRLRTRRG